MDADKAHKLADEVINKDLKNLEKHLSDATEKVNRLIKMAIDAGEYETTLHLDALCQNVKTEIVKNEIWWNVIYYLRNKKFSVKTFSKEKNDGFLFRYTLIKW
jgi:hypothetical protein